MDQESKKSCPFCGSPDLRTVEWSDESGAYDATECNNCLGAAPSRVWNQRSSDSDYWRGFRDALNKIRKVLDLIN